ncbi:MAG TPA: retropepsin-like aspartic protease [Pyrinomonadaceae bacterium]|nr:retropepsin-like aspartic protease [Pyrinomonadaceae bacterium]
MKILSKTILLASMTLAVAPAAVAQVKKGPTEAKTKVTFPSGRAALRIPIEVDNNIIILSASVNGKPPIRLIFDTGASHTVINADRADQLGIKGSERVSGTATGGAIEGTMATGVKIAIAGVEVSNQPVGLISMPRVPGFDFDGVIGFDFIRAFVVQIDYVNKVMDLYDARSYRYRGKGILIPLSLKGRRTPLMSASFIFGNGPSSRAKLELDTGADNAFLLYYPFVEKHSLLKTSKDLAANAGRGAGGETERLIGQAKQVTFGPLAFNNVPVLFSLQKEGLEEGGSVDGIIGGEVLRRFKVIIDYSRSRMILEANKDINDPFDIEG